MDSGWGSGMLDELDAELDRSEGYPVAALILGSIFMVIVAVIVFSAVPIDITAHVGAAFAISALVAGAVYGAAWLLTLRHARTGWKIAAGIAYFVLGLMSVATVVGTAKLTERMDIAALDQIHLNDAGEPVGPPGANGPVVKMGLAYIRAMIDERNKREALLVAKLGLDRIADASALTMAPELLRDCDRFARAKADLDASDQRYRAIITKFRTSLSAAIKDDGARREALDGMDRAFRENGGQLDEMSAIQHQQLDAAGGLCTLLARRNWHDRGSVFAFTTAGDLAAFDRQIAPWNELVKKQAALSARAKSEQLDRMGNDRSRF